MIQDIKEFLKGVRAGKIKEKEALNFLRRLPFRDLDFAKIDHHRTLRRGMPEVILGLGKTKEQIVKIAEEMIKYSDVLITKTNEDVFKEIKNLENEAVYHHSAGIIAIKKEKRVLHRGRGRILILSAGTSDIPVAEEAAITAEFFGNNVERIYDVGVAGLHRLLANFRKISESSVIVAVAGMDGALASVVSGLTDKPVIAVPTSVGYGSSFKGIAPLLAMLNSCSPGVAVVNIDNGFGAAYLASIINK